MACGGRVLLGSKEDAGLGAAGDGVAAHNVVSVVMADGNAEAIAGNRIFLRDSPANPPAKENADIVSLKIAPADEGALRAAARMQSEPAVAVRITILHQHVMTDLP